MSYFKKFIIILFVISFEKGFSQVISTTCSKDTCTDWVLQNGNTIHVALIGWSYDNIWYPYTIHPTLIELNNSHLFRAYSNEWSLEIFMSSQTFLASIKSFNITIINNKPVILND